MLVRCHLYIESTPRRSLHCHPSASHDTAPPNLHHTEANIKTIISGIGNPITLLWRHNGLDGVPNHQPHDCLLNCLFRRRWKKTSKLRVTGLCAGNSLGTGEFPAQMASNAENVSIWWCHHGYRESHYKDKTVMRLSYLYNGKSYTCKTASLYWDL